MSIFETIEKKLKAGLTVEFLEIIDDSADHAGHIGARPGGESHFSVEVTAKEFTGLSRIDRHKLINNILKDELKNQVHALSIKALSPEELMLEDDDE